MDKGPPDKASMNEDDILYALKAMHYIRRIESKAAEMYRLRFIYGFLHLYIGQVNFIINRINRHKCDRNRKKSNNKNEMNKRERKRKEEKKCICIGSNSHWYEAGDIG